MSRIGNKPVIIPDGVNVNVVGNSVEVSGHKGTIKKSFNRAVEIKIVEKEVKVITRPNVKDSGMHSGTVRSIINNMVVGVDKGFEKKLKLVGVGYRAKAEGKVLNLILGFSHPINHKLPEGVKVETPSQTEIVLKSADKETLGQVAADIRSYRKPEAYKGKGIRYSDERIKTKEAKKK